MSKPKGWLPAWLLVLAAVGMASTVRAQEPATPTEESDIDSENDSDRSGGIPLGLYLSVAVGSADADELNTSIETVETHQALSSLALDGQQFARAAVGWRLPKGKGDFRLVFNGYNEQEYDARSRGLTTAFASNSATGGFDFEGASEPLRWWDMQIADGQLTAIKRAPTWEPTQFQTDMNGQIIRDQDGNCLVLTPGDDANCNALADPEEVRYPTIDATVSRIVPDSLENQIQTWDVLYGREFGGRRFSSRWWTGLRYMQYKGNIVTGAWLSTTSIAPGEGFTSGTLLNPLVFAQEAAGWGPTGSWEVDFNFFNKGLVLFARGQAAFTFNTVEADSGDFFTLINDPAFGWISAPARIDEERDKSSWQNTIEGGARVMLRNGLQFEVGYSLTGYLDVVLLPFDITVPDEPGQRFQGTSALFRTQDYRLETVHAGIAYQF